MVFCVFKWLMNGLLVELLFVAAWPLLFVLWLLIECFFQRALGHSVRIVGFRMSDVNLALASSLISVVHRPLSFSSRLTLQRYNKFLNPANNF